MAVVAFLEVSHSLVRSWLSGWFSARCSLFHRQLGPPVSPPAFEDMAVVEEAVRMMPTACGDSDSRSFRTKRSRSVAMGNQLAVRLAGGGGPILVASRSEIG